MDITVSFSKGYTVVPGLTTDGRFCPGSPVYKTDHTVLTYVDLFEKSNRMAAYLQHRKLEKESIVGIFVGEAIGEFMIAVLAVLKINLIYMPLARSTPFRYQQKILSQTLPQIIVTTTEFVDYCRKLVEAAGTKTDVLVLDELTSIDNAYSPLESIDPADPASLYFTSGTSGEPKGILRSYSHILSSQSKNYFPEFSEGGSVAATLTPNFAGFTVPMFSVMLRGGWLHWWRTTDLTPSRMLQQIVDNNIEVLCVSLGLIRSLFSHQSGISETKCLKWLVNGSGEVVYRRDIVLCRRVFGPQCRFVNRYGSTEMGLIASFGVPDDYDPDYHALPAGSPSRPGSIGIVNERGEEIPNGEAGEVVVYTDHFAGEYWQNKAETERKYIAANKSGALWMFKTGDLGRLDEASCLWLLGRQDSQLKIRGFRIDPGALDSVMIEYDGVGDCCTLPIKHDEETMDLVSFVLPAKGTRVEAASLRSFIREQLPDYMVPSEIHFVDIIPRNLNGKIDRSKLLALRKKRPRNVIDCSPDNEVQRRLIGIWCEILEEKPVSTKDSFFDIGGDSLRAILLLRAIAKEFKTELPSAVLIENDSIDALTNLLSRRSAEHHPDYGYVINPLGDRRPIFLVHGAGGVSFIHAFKRHLSEQQPLYLFGGDDDPYCAKARTIQELSAHHIAKIHRVQAMGPYTIGGRWSALVLEVVKQLEDAKESVSEVIIFDVAAPLLRSTQLKSETEFRSIQPLYRRVLHSAANTRYGMVSKKLYHEIFHRGQLLKLHLKYGDLVSSLLRIYHNKTNIHPPEIANKKNKRLYSYYTPRAYKGRIILIRSEGNFRKKRKQKDVQSWKKIAQGALDIQVVPGTHGTMWYGPHAEELVKCLETCLFEDRGH